MLGVRRVVIRCRHQPTQFLPVSGGGLALLCSAARRSVLHAIRSRCTSLRQMWRHAPQPAERVACPKESDLAEPFRRPALRPGRVGQARAGQALLLTVHSSEPLQASLCCVTVLPPGSCVTVFVPVAVRVDWIDGMLSPPSINALLPPATL